MSADSRESTDVKQSTPVDEDVIAGVARRHDVHEGRLRNLLERLETPQDLADLDDRLLTQAAGAALRQHGEEIAAQKRDAWEGERAFSEEFQRVVTVSCVYDPTSEEVLEGIVPVDVLVDSGERRYTETTTVDTLTAVDGVDVVIEGDAAEAHELLEVLEAGIEAVEANDQAALADDVDDRAHFARTVRQAVYDQHNRIDNGLTTRAAPGAE